MSREFRTNGRNQRTAFAIATTCVLALLPASCSSPTETSRGNLGPVPNVAFTTDTTGYVAYRLPGSLARYQFRVISRYENRAAFTVYLGRCFPNSPQPLFTVPSTSPKTPSAYEGGWACVGHDQQFQLHPGEARVDTLVVEGPNSFDGKTYAPFGETEGDFQLYYDVRLAAGDGAPEAPDSLKRSNAFRVRTSNQAPP